MNHEFGIFDWIVIGFYLVSVVLYFVAQWNIRDVFKRIGRGEIGVVKRRPK